MKRAERTSRDRGVGLIEVLAAITLLGLAGVGTLTAINAAIRGSSTHEKLSGARRWVVSAADYVTSSEVARMACTAGEAEVRAHYQTIARGVTDGRPDGWSASQLTVRVPVLFWNGSTFGSTCYESSGLRLQQITFVAVNVSGEVDEVITVVKGND